MNHWPLMHGGPWTTTAIVMLYALFVLVVGPRFMRDRKAFNLKPAIIAFDVTMVVYNALLVIGGDRSIVANSTS